jgi:hypothetical protein
MVNKRFFLVIFISFCFICIAYTQNNNLELVKLSQVVLYQPNSVLEKRTNANDLVKYINDIMKCYNDYLLTKNYRNDASAIILFAFNANNQKRIWLIDNYSNSNNNILYNLLLNINAPVSNESSVATAIFIGNYNELNARIDRGFYLPDEWLNISRDSNRSLTIDDILDIIWAK